MADQSLLSTVRSDLTAERDRLEAQIASLEPGHGAASPDFDDNFADSGQVAAEQGENKVAGRPAARASSTRSSGRWPSSTTAPTACARRAARRSRAARLEAMPAARFCIDHAVGRRWRRTSHLVKRFFGSLRPGGPAGERRGVGRGQPAARRARRCGGGCPGPTAATRSGWRERVERALGDEATRPVLAAALLHDVGKIESGPRHLRAGRRHAVGRGRRRRDGRRPGASSAASPAGSASTSSTTGSAATCSSWPAATRSPWPGPASTTAPRPSGPSTRPIGDALKAADDD